MTTLEYEYALDMRMRHARREAVRPLTGREVALAVAHARDEAYGVSLDLAGMKRIVIDPVLHTVRIQPGVSTRELVLVGASSDDALACSIDNPDCEACQ